MRRAARMSVHRDHDVGGFDDDGGLAARLDAEVIDGFVGDRGGDDMATSDVDADMRGGSAILDSDDGAFELVTCSDPHLGPHNASRALANCALRGCNENSGPSSPVCRGLTAPRQ